MIIIEGPLTAFMKSKWIYGIIMGTLLIVLQATGYRTIIRDISFEVYGLIIGLMFTGIGIWIGLLIFHEKLPKIKVPHKKHKIYQLSDREFEVLNAMVDGLSNQEIADRLFVSLNTIKTHTSNIYMKLNVKRRTQAIQKAREHHLI